jgi:glycosyl hydrolase family 19 (putative chitinase)
MSGALLLLQQQVASPRPVLPCWQLWPVSTIASTTQCPVENVSTDWPAIYAALEARGIANPSVCAGVIGTIAIETASTFQPVREAYWLSEDWRQAHLRYYPWYGRGYVQLTWQSNYANYGQAIGVDLTTNPDVAMDRDVAAKVLAEFFVESGAAGAAGRNDWTECRRLVQGGSAGLDRLVGIVRALGMPC